MIKPTKELALGDYEKQVLLELDKRITWFELTNIRNRDKSFRLLTSIISNSYNMKQTVKDCVVKVMITFEPTM